MPLSKVTNHAVKSDRDGYGYKGMKDKQMDRWKSEYNGRRRVRRYSDKDIEKKLSRKYDSLYIFHCKLLPKGLGNIQNIFLLKSRPKR